MLCLATVSASTSRSMHIYFLGLKKDAATVYMPVPQQKSPKTLPRMDFSYSPIIWNKPAVIEYGVMYYSKLTLGSIKPTTYSKYSVSFFSLNPLYKEILSCYNLFLSLIMFELLLCLSIYL